MWGPCNRNTEGGRREGIEGGRRGAGGEGHQGGQEEGLGGWGVYWVSIRTLNKPGIVTGQLIITDSVPFDFTAT
jgi:hypothetical protein